MKLNDPAPDAKSDSAMDRAAEHLSSARAHRRAGELSKAAEILRTLLQQQPGLLSAATELVRTLEAGSAETQVAGHREAATVMRRLIASAPTTANIMAAAQFWERLQNDAPFTPDTNTIRLALTGHGTLNSLAAHLSVSCAQMELQPFVFVSGFDQWMQDLLLPNSTLYAAKPEVILLQLDTISMFPKSMNDAELSEADFDVERAAGITQIRQAIAAAAQNAPAATVLLATFAVPDYSPLGILDLSVVSGAAGQRARCHKINADLAAMIGSEFPATLLLDMERVEARHGKGRVRDARRWYMASIPFSDSFLPVLSAEYLRYLRPLKGMTRKCVVLDLDNTLWGGVIGEDGFDQIKIGGTAAPGNAYKDFQKALLALQQRGILLAICSKNNPDDVWPVFSTHPEMVLRKEHFAAWQINWQDKSSNIREIAHSLNIGLDSLVFLDDNPAERGQVRQEVPQVLTVELPSDPALYVNTLLELDVFEVLKITDEDRNRSRLYREQMERQVFEKQLEQPSDTGGMLTKYLHELQIKVTISHPTPFTLPRIAQLINKTNQFNVTTRRYTEAQLGTFANDPDHWRVVSVHVRDRFGDSGLTGVAMVRIEGETWEVDNFLLSCRVLGRGVEDALMTYIANEAAHANASRLLGKFIRTPKNAPTVGFFEKQGFVTTAVDGDTSLFERELKGDVEKSSDINSTYPEWLSIKIAVDGHRGSIS